MNNPAMLTSSAVRRRQRAREGARLQGRALRLHSVPHQKIFLTVYPLSRSEAVVVVVVVVVTHTKLSPAVSRLDLIIQTAPASSIPR